MPKKILISGACGFIGSQLAEVLSDAGYPLILLDDLSSGSMENISWARPGTNIDFVESKLDNSSGLLKLLKSCSQVIHLAADTSVQESVARPRETHANNMDSTLNLLDASRLAGAERFLFASSASVYGDCKQVLPREETPVNPLSPYAVQKLTCEHYIRLYSHLYGLPGVSLRLFNVYGTKQSESECKSGVIARFCRQMLQGFAPVVHGDGSQTRDFIFISDVVAAFIRSMDASVEKIAGRAFNIASGRSNSLIEIVECINRLTSQNLVPQFLPARAGEIQKSQANIEAAREMLGFVPQVRIVEGLSKTLEHEKGRLGATIKVRTAVT